MPSHRFSFESSDPAVDKPRFFAALRKHGLSAGWSPPIANEVELILEEWWTNLVNYAFAEVRDPRIAVHIDSDDQHARIEVQDNGFAFDPSSRPDLDRSLPIEERPIGGLGIYMIKQLSAQLHSKRVGDYNVLIVEKDLGRPILGQTKG